MARIRVWSLLVCCWWLGACAASRAEVCSPDALRVLEAANKAESRALLSTGVCDEFGEDPNDCPAWAAMKLRQRAVYDVYVRCNGE